jgi:hypothetical protein
MQKTLKSYFFWTHQRGSFHYDVMVTLILVFIFATPHLWNFGDKPSTIAALAGPIQVVGDGDHGLVITVPMENVGVSLTASERVVRKALHRAIQPVTGDAVSVVRWETIADANGQPTHWKVWAHR